MNTNNYVRTDLAAESPIIENEQLSDGITATENKLDMASISTVEITNKNGEKAIGKPIGTYITISFDKIWRLDDITQKRLSYIISENIKKLANIKNEKLNILICGLGNRYITSDAVGPLVIKDITATSHLEKADNELFKLLNSHSISAISPGVIGQTGIETLELIRGAVNSVNSDVLIVIDALCSKSVDRLGSTVQICNTGISPGSGIGNKRHAINKDTVGIPVIAIGVPTMVSSSTLVYDALEKASITDISDKLTDILENGKSFFVTLNENDVVISSLASLIASALNSALTLE